MQLPLIVQADSYKYSHFRMFPNGTTMNNSYVESRGIDVESGLPDDARIVFFGLQAFIREHLIHPITKSDVDLAENMITAHGLPFNREDWDIIVDEFGGYLPIRIEAIPEGTPTKAGVVLVQVQNTDPRFAWLASFIETAVLRAIWYPTTVATVSREVKRVIHKWNNKTSQNALLDFQLHDFGARGVSSSESAQLGGMAHLVNFKGTDTVEALFAANYYYDQGEPAGFSVPAAEHSTILAHGRAGEFDAYQHIITEFSGGIVSVVSDTWDIYNAVDNLWPQLKEQLEREGTTLVVRPDSGDPATVCVNVAEILAKHFGTTLNSKGYKVLNGVRIIQGDGVNITSINAVLSQLADAGFASENMVFGMGGALLQKVNRDTLKFAMKTSYVKVNGNGRDVKKTPVGASWKNSKAGVQDTIEHMSGCIYSKRRDAGAYTGTRILKPVFENGVVMRNRELTFEQVRRNATV